ncbi:MAG: hypothetical protein ABJF01_23975 [bacterium]
MSLDALAKDLRDATLDVIWRQWASLGAGAASRSHAHAVVDPEALVLASLALVSNEPRLADLLHDWITRNADLLSVQRAKNLARDHDAATRSLIGDGLQWLASIAVDEGKDLRWRSLLTGERTAGSPWIAPSVRSAKRRAVRVRVAEPSVLMLRLRLAFGVGVKGDLISCLLCLPDEPTTVRAIADMTGYTPAAVRRAAEDLAAAQFIESRDAQPAAYRLSRTGWNALLKFDDETLSWKDWRHVFAFALAFLEWYGATAAETRTPYVIGVQGRELLERHRPVFERDRIALWGPHTRVEDWASFTTTAVKALARWMRDSV